MIYIGDFYNSSAELCITDPAYDKSDAYLEIVNHCAIGVWEAYVEKQEVEYWGECVAKLVVKFKKPGQDILLPIGHRRIGVDSGRLGIFDYALYGSDMKTLSVLDGKLEYEENPLIKAESSSDFYDVVCDKTLGINQGGVVEYGAVSSSGLGEGLFKAVAKVNDLGTVCEIEVDFHL